MKCLVAGYSSRTGFLCLHLPAMEVLPEVCRACLLSSPGSRKLLDYGCFAMSGAHDGIPFVRAAWDNKFQVIVEVRPLPLVTLQPGSWFTLCRGTNCRETRCTYAHSVPELKQWNKELQLQRSSLASKSQGELLLYVTTYYCM